MMKHQEFLSGFIRLNSLHHAVESEFFGNWMIEELREHGYKIAPGTLYPMLHGLETKGYLKSRTEGTGRRVRRHYRATRNGREALGVAIAKLRELSNELVKDR
jgi:PadR family transcriptional regulator, regulatory protein PadR